jgi:hypothetical protein
MVLEMIRQGRLVLVIGGQESQNYSKRAIRLESTQIRVSRDGMSLDLFLGGRSRAILSQAKAKGDCSPRVHSDHMVLAVVRWEVGLIAWWPKTLK